MTNVDRCLEVLREGPATAFDVGMEVGLSSERVATCMLALIKRGVVVTRPFTQMLPHEPQRRLRLYELADYGVQA